MTWMQPWLSWTWSTMTTQMRSRLVPAGLASSATASTQACGHVAVWGKIIRDLRECMVKETHGCALVPCRHGLPQQARG